MEIVVNLVMFLLVAYYLIMLKKISGTRGYLDDTKVERTETIFISANPIESYKTILQSVIQNGYNIDDINERTLEVLLSEKTVFPSNILYLISVFNNDKKEGGSVIKMGVGYKVRRFLRDENLELKYSQMKSLIKGAVFIPDEKSGSDISVPVYRDNSLETKTCLKCHSSNLKSAVVCEDCGNKF